MQWQEAEHTSDLRGRLPSWAMRVSDNYNHLFEAPTLFYAISLAILVGGLADPIHASCAWLFFVCRVGHSAVQATINRAPFRAALFGLSWITLAVMIIRGTAALF